MTRSNTRSLILVLLAGASLAACATPHPRLATRLPGEGAGPSGAAPSGAGGRYKVGLPYQVAGVWYVPKEEPQYDQTGTASWYGDEFHNKSTANGEIFDMNLPSAAHTTLPMPSIVEVTNLDNGRKINVRVNDRGPFIGGRLIDLSHEGARQLGYDRQGLARVRVRYVGPAQLGGPDTGQRMASIAPAPEPVVAPPPWTPTFAPVAVASVPLAPLAPLGPTPGVTETRSVAQTPVSSGYRVQAGAFSDQANAQRVASQLAETGTATIEPVQRADGVTLYRVMIQGGSDETGAWSLRERVASLGFSEARVLRPF